ncbi:hypothetical protein BC2230_11657 [Burkholderia cepacia]
MRQRRMPVDLLYVKHSLKKVIMRGVIGVLVTRLYLVAVDFIFSTLVRCRVVLLNKIGFFIFGKTVR